MFKIEDGRECFYQWDSAQRLIVSDASITEVHFCNKTGECSLVCEVFEEDGKRLVNVPNILLQENRHINVYAYDDCATKNSAVFKVIPRSKPEDYLYTETEVVAVKTVVNEAMQEAKDSGVFDGYTPVKGTDYWTEEDIAEIKSYVDDAILGGKW